MENKIAIGDYIRTVNGEIHKVIEIIEDINDWNYYKYENNMGDFEINIVKHSKNIIDLIEAGDIIHYKLKELNCYYCGIVHSIKDLRTLENKLRVSNYSLEQVEILEILAKEKFESECFKVEEGQDV